MREATLHLVCGLPGAGKTTLARRLEAQTGAVRLCPDEWMETLGVSIFDSAFRDGLERKLTELAGAILRLGGDAIIEFGSWARAERLALRDLARQNGARANLYWLEVPVSELSKRLLERGGPDAALLDEKYLQDTSDRIERPTEEEGASFDEFHWLEYSIQSSDKSSN